MRWVRRLTPSCSTSPVAPIVAFHGKPDGPLCDFFFESSQENFAIGKISLLRTLKLCVTLSDLYLCNQFVFEPILPDGKTASKLGLYYILEISKDNHDWKTFLDYSQHFCYGKQILDIPMISLRFTDIFIVLHSFLILISSLCFTLFD